MKKIMTIALLCTMTMFATTGCSPKRGSGFIGAKKMSGTVATRNRKTKEFDKIHIEGSLTVYYTQGSKVSVVVKADESIINNIKTTVSGNTLSITYDGKSYGGLVFNGDISGVMKVYVTSPDIMGIKVFGSGDFISEKKIDTDNITIQLKGSGDVNINSIICDNISTSLDGSGDIDIKQADALKASIELVGSGDIDMGLANARITDIKLKGAGDIDIDFRNCGTVRSQLKGSGDIKLKGYVKHFEKDEHGSGEHDTSKLSVSKH